MTSLTAGSQGSQESCELAQYLAAAEQRVNDLEKQLQASQRTIQELSETKSQEVITDRELAAQYAAVHAAWRSAQSEIESRTKQYNELREKLNEAVAAARHNAQLAQQLETAYREHVQACQSVNQEYANLRREFESKLREQASEIADLKKRNAEMEQSLAGVRSLIGGLRV